MTEETLEEDKSVEPKKKIIKHKTARGKFTRYSCLYSTMPSKSRSPPKA